MWLKSSFCASNECFNPVGVGSVRTEAFHSPICHKSETQEREVNPKNKHFGELHETKFYQKKKKKESVAENPKMNCFVFCIFLFFVSCASVEKKRRAGRGRREHLACLCACVCARVHVCAGQGMCIWVGEVWGGCAVKWKVWRWHRGMSTKRRKSGDKRQHVDHRQRRRLWSCYCVTSLQDKVQILLY